MALHPYTRQLTFRSKPITVVLGPPVQVHSIHCNRLCAVTRFVHNATADQEKSNGDQCGARNGTYDDASYSTMGESPGRTVGYCVTDANVTPDERDGRRPRGGGTDL